MALWILNCFAVCGRCVSNDARISGNRAWRRSQLYESVPRALEDPQDGAIQSLRLDLILAWIPRPSRYEVS